MRSQERWRKKGSQDDAVIREPGRECAEQGAAQEQDTPGQELHCQPQIHSGLALPLDFLCAIGQWSFRFLTGKRRGWISYLVSPSARQSWCPDSPRFPRRSPGRQAPLPADQALPLRPRPRPQGRARIGPFEMRWRELTWVHCASPGFSGLRAWACESRFPRSVPAAHGPGQASQWSPASRARVWAARSRLPWSQRKYWAASQGSGRGEGGRRLFTATPAAAPKVDAPTRASRGEPGHWDPSPSRTPPHPLRPPPGAGRPPSRPGPQRPGKVGPNSRDGEVRAWTPVSASRLAIHRSRNRLLQPVKFLLSLRGRPRSQGAFLPGGWGSGGNSGRVWGRVLCSGVGGWVGGLSPRRAPAFVSTACFS